MLRSSASYEPKQVDLLNTQGLDEAGYLAGLPFKGYRNFLAILLMLAGSKRMIGHHIASVLMRAGSQKSTGNGNASSS